ncbi:MAG: L,D-transpeptidase family protein [Lachnospiraceae bacterium]|nr:L,D-transpeptidase family protein [Lachnospiraceae bacterium]
MKRIVTLLLVFIIGVSSSFTALADMNYVNSGPGAAKWEQQSNGGWKYKKGQDYVVNDWVDIDNETYLLDSNGYMVTGWQVRAGKLCYFSKGDAEGRPMGALFRDQTTPDGHQVDAQGILVGDPWFRVNPYEQSCIEVSIAEQHVYVYDGAVPIVDSPCVTGKVSTGTVTPTGNYAIQAKIPDKTLKGKNVDGTDYESFVHFWMPFNGGYGLHDASWRNKFGGEIYKTGGSHGCVNLPTAKAQEIWNVIWVGMPVYVHE